MLILIETAAGYALFKLKDKKILKSVDTIANNFDDPESAKKLVQLEAFKKFKDTKEALKSTLKIQECKKLPKDLKKFLKKNIVSKKLEQALAVSDKRLAKLVNDKFGIKCKNNKKTHELMRGIKSQMASLVEGLSEEQLRNMSLSLTHGLSRYKLKFSSEKVDTMIIQAISIIEDLDKEINNYMMRLKEWFGWHFPEMQKIIADGIVYAKIVKMAGNRLNIIDTEFGDILPEDLNTELKDVAKLSMGSDITDMDEKYIRALAEQILELQDYKESLNEYLKSRMQAIAPNTSTLIGEQLAAKLISKAGSLINLAKYPASTVQLLGAEKALFKAMRAKSNTPKYGFLYQASLVGQVSSQLKGKVCRTLAAKCALCIRTDALKEKENNTLGVDCKVYVEKRIRFLESNQQKSLGTQGKAPFKKDFNVGQKRPRYNQESDFTLGQVAPIKDTFVKSKQMKM